MKSAKRLKTTTLTDFAKQTKKRRGGQRSPLSEHSRASADVTAFGKMKDAGETDASWAQFAVWLRETHGIDMRANSLYTWYRNRSRADGNQ